MNGYQFKTLFSLIILIFFVACVDKKESKSSKYLHATRIYDGDTFESNGIVYRLAEIDAPEKKQTYGQQSKLYLASLIYNKELKIIPVTTDKYGRIIAKVYVGDRYISQEMIKSGNAWFYERYSDNKTLRQLQISARQNKIGLWQYPAISPYQFRKFNK